MVYCRKMEVYEAPSVLTHLFQHHSRHCIESAPTLLREDVRGFLEMNQARKLPDDPHLLLSVCLRLLDIADKPVGLLDQARHSLVQLSM